MDKKTIQKNILDLEYKKQLQTQNVILLFGTTSVLPLISSFVWYPERLALGLLLTFLISLVAYFKYKEIDENLDNIINKIKGL